MSRPLIMTSRRRVPSEHGIPTIPFLKWRLRSGCWHDQLVFIKLGIVAQVGFFNGGICKTALRYVVEATAAPKPFCIVIFSLAAKPSNVRSGPANQGAAIGATSVGSCGNMPKKIAVYTDAGHV